MRSRRWMCAAAVLVLGGMGCGGPREGGGVSRTGAAPPPVRQISTQGLPKLSDPIAPVDEGRLEVAPPEKWHVPPRSRKWAARFQADPGSPYPMIFVTAEESRGAFHVTRANLDEFAAEVRKELLADPDAPRLAAGLQPVVVGNFHGALYRRWGKSGARVMERWMLETVANGRRYTLELRSREGLADEYLPHLYAVASGMKFTKGQGAGAAVTAVELDPDDATIDEQDRDEDEDDVDAP